MISQILERYGCDLSRVHRENWTPVKCPFHDDRTASASVSLGKDAFVCHACGVKGDAISIVKQREGLEYADALEFIAHLTGETSGILRKPARRDAREQQPSRFRTKLFE